MPQNVPFAHACVTVGESVLRQVSQATSFEMSFSRIVLGDTSVPILGTNPCIKGWIMHPLFGIVSVNDMA